MSDKIKPYQEKPENYGFIKWNTYIRIVSSFVTFDISTRHQQWVLEALHDEETWDWYKDCNGATFVSEPGWKGRHSPPYVRHDYKWEKEGPTWKSNVEMRELQVDYGMDDWRSDLRFAGVTFIGMPVYKTVRWFKSWF